MTSTYRHFCTMARALEVVGERWTLLLVRDLLLGTARFTDLERSLTGITPKQLTHRLRELEAAGLVEREREEGRREVWYRLTPKAQDLAPAVEALTSWGLEHASRPPLPGEAVHAQHVMNGLKIGLNGRGARPGKPVSWTFRFLPDGAHTLRFDGERWETHPGEGTADLVVSTTPQAWARFLMEPAPAPSVPTAEVRVEGKARNVAALNSTLGRK